MPQRLEKASPYRQDARFKSQGRERKRPAISTRPVADAPGSVVRRPWSVNMIDASIGTDVENQRICQAVFLVRRRSIR